MTRRRHHSSTCRYQLVTTLLTTGLTASASALAALEYTMTFEWTEGGSGTEQFRVVQDGMRAIAYRDEDTAPALYSDPTENIDFAQVPRFVSQFPLWLIETAPRNVRRGLRQPHASGGEEHIESLTFDLAATGKSRSVADRTLEEHILSATLHWTWHTPSGNVQEQTTEVAAHLWTDRARPFTWLPYGAQGVPGAMPMVFHHPGIAGHVREALTQRLKTLGLLVEADIEITFHQRDGAIAQNFTRTVRVAGIEESSATVPAFPAEGTIEMRRFQALFAGMAATGRTCESPDLKPDSLEVRKNSARRLTLSGKAVVSEPNEDQVAMVAGRLDREATHSVCAVVWFPADTAPEAGSWNVAPFGQHGSADDTTVSASIMTGNRDTMRVILADEGTLKIRNGRDGASRGRLNATAWAATLSEQASSVDITENLKVRVDFDLSAPTEDVSDSPTESDTPATTFEPAPLDLSQAEPTASLALDDEAVVFGAVMPGGGVAAVGLKAAQQVALIDLNTYETQALVDLPPGHSARVTALDFAAGKRLLAIGANASQVLVVNADSGEIVHRLQTPVSTGGHTNTGAVRFLKGGTRLVQANGADLVVWDIEKGEVVRSWQAAKGTMYHIAASPDGEHLVSVDLHGGATVWNTANAERVCELSGQFASMAMHPDGTRFVLVGRDARAQVIDTQTCQQRAAWDSPQEFVPSAAWSGDGEHILFGTSKGRVVIYTQDGEPAGEWAVQESMIRVATAPGTGTVLISGNSDGSKAVLYGR